MNGVFRDSTHYIDLGKTPWGKIEAYVPDVKEMKSYAENAGFSKLEIIPYVTGNGRKRVIFELTK